MEYQPTLSLNDTPPDHSSTTNAGTGPLVDVRAIKRARDRRLRALAKNFGHIPGIPIFSLWNTRLECSDTAVHRPTVAGIDGSQRDGTYSLAISNSYKDNEDGGDIIIYTGAGGRKKWSDAIPPKRLRIGPQVLDQSWNECRNGALLTSLETGNQIRVVRSWRSSSQYAPLKGYRYDGLYRVAACWTAKGHNGKDICRCRLERLPDQPPIPLRPITISTRKRQCTSYHHTPMTDTEPNTGDIGFNPSPASSSMIGGESSVGFSDSNPPQQRAASEASTLVDFNMGELADQDTKASPQPPPERCAPYAAGQPRYRWDPCRNELVRIQDPQPIPEDLVAADEELGDISIADDEVDEQGLKTTVTQQLFWGG